MNFVKRYWKGGYSLGLSFWVFTLLLGIFVSVGVRVVGKLILPWDIGPEYNLAWIVGVEAFLLAVFVWQFVGLWRSARQARIVRRSRGKWAVWSYLACATLVLIGCFYTYVRAFVGPPLTTELFNMVVRGDPSLPPYGIRFMRGDTEVLVEGGFRYGIAADFAAAIKNKPKLRVVHLNSWGGRVREGMKMYEEIRRRELDTYVATKCASACTQAFAGGKLRWILDRPVIGLHNASLFGKAVDKVDENAFAIVFARAGCQADFIHHVLATPPSSLWSPTPAELLKAHFVTGIATLDRFAASDLGLKPTAATIARQYREVDVWVKLWSDSAQKESFAAFVERVRLLYEDGASLADRFTSQRHMFRQAARHGLTSTNDATIRSHLSLMIELYKTLQAKDPLACYKFDRDDLYATDIERIAGPALEKRRNDLIKTIFEESGKVPAPSRSVAAALRTRLSSKLAETLPADDRALLDTAQTDAAKQAGVCRAKIALLRAVADMGPDDAPTAMRVILQSEKRQDTSAR